MPLRFPRPVMALIAASTVAVSIGVAAVPAQADQVRHAEWWLTKLGVTGAWAASQGAGVTVAVLSDGVDGNQSDLTGAVTTAPALAGAPVASGVYFGEQGTAIASLIAGRLHGSRRTAGIVGVAPEARILSIPVTLPADDPRLSKSAIAASIPDAIAAGIRYAVKQGATVIDLPIDPGQPGSSGTGGAVAAAGGSPAEKSAISYALGHDVVLVAPAGDDGTASDAPDYPAAYHGVVAVGAFNSAFVKAPWSSHQSYVTLTAAGVGMLASSNTGGYQTVSSTSGASAVVSGIVALIRSRYPRLTAQQITASLTKGTVFRHAGGRARGSGYGAVNAVRAMAYAAKLSTPPADRAGAGAQPAQAPGAVAAPSTAQSIVSSLGRAGEISGALLVLLLLLIGLYAAVGRRRNRGGPPAVTAQWAHRQAQSRYPQVGDFVQGSEFASAGGFARRSATDADRLLEAFAVPVARPDQGVSGQPAGHTALNSRADEGLFAPPARPASAAPGTGSGARGGGAPESGPWPSHGPATRAVGRRPAVSGAPPWDPASAPDTELPWAGASGRHSGSSPDAAPAEGQRQLGYGDGGWDASAGPESSADSERSADSDGSAAWDGRGWSPLPAAGPVAGGGSDLWSRSAPGDDDAGWGFSPSPPSESSAVQPSWGADDHWPDEPRSASSGLPIRRPGSALPAPLSPSGSLWDPVERDPVDGSQGDGQDPGGRPIYVWDPSHRRSPAPRHRLPPED